MKNTFILILITILSACTPSKEEKRDAEIKEIKTFVSSSLKDPTSPLFRNEAFSGSTLCGEINSKNSFGAYVGFKRFYSLGMKYAAIEGIGIVAGKEEHESMLRSLEIETEIYNNEIERMKSGQERFSEETRKTLILNKLFDEGWKRNCQ